MLPENVVVIILTVPSIRVNTNFLFFWWEFKLEMLLVTSTQQLPWQPQGMADVMTTEIGKLSARAWRRQQRELVSGVSSCQAVRHWGVKKQRKKNNNNNFSHSLIKMPLLESQTQCCHFKWCVYFGRMYWFFNGLSWHKDLCEFFVCLFVLGNTEFTESKANLGWCWGLRGKRWGTRGKSKRSCYSVMLWTKIVPVRDASGSEKQQMYKVNWKLSGNVRSSLRWDIFCHNPGNLVTGVERRMLPFERASTTRH